MGQTAGELGRSQDETADTRQIRQEIDRTRSDMSSTIDAIQQKLNPTVLKEQAKEQAMLAVRNVTEQAKEQAKDTVRDVTEQAKETVRAATIGKVQQMADYTTDTVKEQGGGFLDTIRENPIPAALAAIGIGWLLFKSRDRSYDEYDDNGYQSYRGPASSRRYGSQTRYYSSRTRRSMQAPDEEQGGVLSAATGTVGKLAGQVKDTVGSVAGSAADVAGSAVGAVGSAASSAAGAVTGAASTAAGAVTGAASSAAGAVGSAAGSAADAVGSAAGSTADTVGSVAGQTKHTVGHAVGSATDTAGDVVGGVGSTVQYGRRRATSGFQQMLEDNPLAVGALALALGTAIGLAVPETQREHRLMGDMRDNLLDQASSKASETFQKVQQVADAAVSTAVREGSQAVQEVKQTAKEEVQKQGLVGSNDQQGQGQQGQGQQGQAQRSMGQSQPMGQGQTPTRTGGQPVSTGENKPVSPPTGQGGASSMPTGPTKKDMSGGEDRLRPGQTGPQTGGQNKP